MTVREFVLALEAYGEERTARFEVIKWQTAQIVRASLSMFAKNPPSVRSIIAGWTPRDPEAKEPELTPMQMSHKRFLEELKATNGGTANPS